MARLKAEFYQQSDVVELSKALLGKYLVTDIDGQRTSGKIVETEAYRGPDDKACHAYDFRRTKRTEVMYLPGGHAYVYLCYGIHHLFNVVTAGKDQPQAVLIRAIEPIEGIELMCKRRNMKKPARRLTAGPGTLSQALGITTALSGIDMLKTDSPIWLEDRGEIITPNQLIASPRIGVAYAEECALWDWRFRIANSSWTSLAK